MQKTIDISNFPDLDCCLVEGGSFSMGDNDSDNDDEKPAHTVAVPSFYMAKYAVTQRLYAAVMGRNPSSFKGELHPVENVSWDEAKVFVEKLNGKIKQSFRLPSEAEWAFAARGGIHRQAYDYAGSDKLAQVGWYNENSGFETKEVGLLFPNELGLYDMSGNVWEWCEDDWHSDYDGAPDDGTAWVDRPKRLSRRLIRGGSYFDGAVGCRPSIRDRRRPDYRLDDIGFRLVFSAV